jgi:hypothetical protein
MSRIQPGIPFRAQESALSPTTRRATCRILLSISLAGALAVPLRAESEKPHLTGLGPDLDGVWDGMFQAGGDAMAVAFNVATVKDQRTITVDILEQHAQDIPVNAASVNGQQVRLDVAALGGTFEGALNADHSAMQGTWIQLGKRIPLTVKRRVPGTAP